jgi:hypothetical protein
MITLLFMRIEFMENCVKGYVQGVSDRLRTILSAKLEAMSSTKPRQTTPIAWMCSTEGCPYGDWFPVFGKHSYGTTPHYPLATSSEDKPFHDICVKHLGRDFLGYMGAKCHVLHCKRWHPPPPKKKDYKTVQIESVKDRDNYVFNRIKRCYGSNKVQKSQDPAQTDKEAIQEASQQVIEQASQQVIEQACHQSNKRSAKDADLSEPVADGENQALKRQPVGFQKKNTAVEYELAACKRRLAATESELAACKKKLKYHEQTDYLVDQLYNQLQPVYETFCRTKKVRPIECDDDAEDDGKRPCQNSK